MTLVSRVYITLLLIFLYLPIAVMIAMGFNESSLYELPFRFSFKWYVALWQNGPLIESGLNSLAIALVTAIVATAVGTMAAIGLARASFRGKALLQVLLLPPIAIPWLITGTAMFVFFFWTGIGRGLHALIIGHIALAIPYVVIIVGTGLKSIRSDLEDAAMSLGSSPVHAFVAVTLPLLAPSLVGAALFSFAVSLDQFVVSYFLASPGFTTLPVKIYAAIRNAFTPEVNAISTILLLGSMTAIVLYALIARPGRSG